MNNATGISIGDVGILLPNGEFDFLFNICLPSDHVGNQHGVPPCFEKCDRTREIDTDRKARRNPPPWYRYCEHFNDNEECRRQFICPDSPVRRILGIATFTSDVNLRQVPAGVEGQFHLTCSTSEKTVLLLSDRG